MRLYAANVSQQAIQLHYRVPENNRSLQQTIPSGRQAQIADDKLNALQIASVVDQNYKYGMRLVTDLEKYDFKTPLTMLFSVDSPVSAGKIQEVIQKNRKEITKTGKERREELAVVAANLIGERNELAGASTSVSIEEDQPGTISSAEGTQLSEGYAGPESTPAKQQAHQGAKPPTPRGKRGNQGNG